MKPVRIIMLIVFAIAMYAPCVFAVTADEVVGKWYTEEKDSIIEIYKENNEYFGKVAWSKEPNENGKPKVDKNNPDPALRNRPSMGLVILKNFMYNGKGVWNEGTIYDPNNGKTYSCKMKIESNGNLNIRGFIGISLLGRTAVWSRAK